MRNIMNRFSLLVLVSLTFATGTFAWPGDAEKKALAETRMQDSLKQVELKNLQREVDALTRIRLQKADSLEKLEAKHWSNRYAEAQKAEEHQNETRELDGRYSKLSTDLGRVSEELMSSKSVTTELDEKAVADESSYDALNLQVKLSLDKTAGDVMGDYPVGMNDRLIQLKKAQDDADGKNAKSLSVLETYLDDQLARHKKTYTQERSQETVQVGNRTDVRVERLRLGTVFLGEKALDNGDVQALMRTGALQGKIFEWNANLPPEMKKEISAAVSGSITTNLIGIPLDILQNKAIKSSIDKTEEQTLSQRASSFFHKGGVVMYPLALIALFALFLCLERFIALSRRGHLGRRFQKKIQTLVSEKNYTGAADLCLKKETSLSMVLFAVLNKASETRDAAEKSLQEALLREQPKLDRRMGLLAAMGSIAPLLGLLGTVTGIITLFTVITEVGTNDARVLAGGISEALITTETGLVIAIPVMILHGLLSEKIERVTSELYVQSTSMLNQIFPDKKKLDENK